MSENKENNDEEKKSKNVGSGGNIFDDSFFDTLNEIDDGLTNTFQKLGSENHENIQDIISEKNLNLGNDKKDLKITSKTLPVSKLPSSKVKEKDDMTKANFDPLNLPADDPNADQIREIWEDMNRPDASDFKLMVLRLEPATIKSIKISGYLETFHLPTSIPDVIEQIGQKYGGGKYQIRIVDGAGKYVKSKTFEISGLPKIPSPEHANANTNANREEGNVQASPNPTNNANVNASAPAPAPAPAPAASANTSKKDEEDDDDDWDDDDDFDPTPRRPRLRPIERPMYRDDDIYSRPPIYQTPYPRPTIIKKDDSKEKELKEVEEKVSKLESKLESKFEKITDLLQNSMNNQNKSGSLFNPDVVKSLAPIVVTWLDGKANKDTNSTSQFSEMNKQVVGLMQGMQDLVRVSDKSKTDFAEKEREERERSRQEMLTYQQQMEQRFIEQQRRADEKHQAMMLQLKESLEGKHKESVESENRMRLEYERLRQEFREKEERTREEARQREEKLREEARLRDETARRNEIEFREKMRQDEARWREEMRQREEESRRRELEFKEELRQKELQAMNELKQKEIQSANDSKIRELEIMKQMRDMDQQKTDMQQKLLEQIYSNNNHNRESQLHMELAIAKMTNDNEARMMQSNAEMQLEKIRHATQMQMAKMKHDLNAIENKRSEDPIDSAMQDYLKRKLQIDMIKDLNMDVDEDDLPNSSFSTTLKKLAEGAGPFLMQLLMGGGPGQMKPPLPVNPNGVRPVSPTIGPMPSVPVNINSDDESEDDLDEEDLSEDEIFDEDESVEDLDQEENIDEDGIEAEQNSPGPDLSGIDPVQEIPRINYFFQHLKEVIETGNGTPEEAAAKAYEMLSPASVDYLSTISDSKVVIDQLYPLLNALGESFAEFFTKPETLAWMNRMLEVMKKKLPNEKEDSVPAVEDKPAAEAPIEDATVVKKPSEVVEVETTKGRKKRQKAKNVQQ